ncbi:unnamed protein product [Brugia timori]|uniref:KID domain-containing protein n=1 Tax=Brugia timori TaxID=42155 RepID=A0A0R3R6Q1_9BILA|nr:unnamed protein product [Brugia timori]
MKHILVQQSTRSSSSSSSQVTQPALVMQASGTSSVQRPVHQVQYISAANIPINSDPNTVVIQRQSVSQNTSQITTMTPGMITFPAGQGQARIIQQGGQQFLMHGSGTANLPTGSSVMILNAGSQIPVTLNNAVVYQPANRQLLQSGQSNPKLEDTIQMLDGATSLAVTSGAGTLKKLAQLDGASRVSDSSSEEEMDEEDDDDPLRTIADRISEEGNAVDDEDQVTEEDPLNSGDDQSDDEDVERLFEAENLVMCQFEKVIFFYYLLLFIVVHSLISSGEHVFQLSF